MSKKSNLFIFLTISLALFIPFAAVMIGSFLHSSKLESEGLVTASMHGKIKKIYQRTNFVILDNGKNVQACPEFSGNIGDSIEVEFTKDIGEISGSKSGPGYITPNEIISNEAAVCVRPKISLEDALSREKKSRRVIFFLWVSGLILLGLIMLIAHLVELVFFKRPKVD